MKKWTRILIPLLIMAMLLSACGGSQSEEEVSGTITPASETTPEVADNPVSMGRMEGGTYTNSYMGFAIDLDSTWVYYSAEELQEMPENVAELLEGTEVGDSLDTMNQFTDMMAESVEDLTTMNVLYQKMTMAERLLYAAMDNEEILDAVLEQKDMLVQSYTAAGMDVQSMEKVTITFLGEDRPALKTMAITQGVEYYILQVFDYHLGQYSITVTFSSFMEDKTADLAAMCYAAE